jgi:hypothetical protein
MEQFELSFYTRQFELQTSHEDRMSIISRAKDSLSSSDYYTFVEKCLELQFDRVKQGLRDTPDGL